MYSEKRELGVIRSTQLGIEDHGILTFWLHFDFGSSGQGFGGYSLDGFDKKKGRHKGSAFGCEAILRILRAVGVENWEDLVGKEMWVIRDNSDMIRGIEAPKYRKTAKEPFHIENLVAEYKVEKETWE